MYISNQFESGKSAERLVENIRYGPDKTVLRDWFSG